MMVFESGNNGKRVTDYLQLIRSWAGFDPGISCLHGMPHRSKMLYTFSYGRHIKLTSHQKTLLACKKVEEM